MRALTLYARGAGAAGAGFGDIFGDLFENIFTGRWGRSWRKSRSARLSGSDLQYNLSLTLEEIAFGKQVEIRVPKLALRGCARIGAKVGTKPVTCEDCQGAGQVRMQQGFFSIQQPCPSCRGAGTVIKDPCPSCAGQGRLSKSKTLTVKIPAGLSMAIVCVFRARARLGCMAGQRVIYTSKLPLSNMLFSSDKAPIFTAKRPLISLAALAAP